MSTESHEKAASVRVVNAYKELLAALDEMGYGVDKDPNFHGTAERAARGFLQIVRPLPDIEARTNELFESCFPASYDQMVLSKHNVVFGMCPHHLLPVIYRVSVAYLPQKRVIGISKLSRMAQLLARRPVLQEQLTDDLADMLHQRLETAGTAVYIEGLHMCMAARGVEAHEARVVTNAVRGMFKDNPITRQEFLDLVRTSHPALL